MQTEHLLEIDYTLSYSWLLFKGKLGMRNHLG